jgi:DNA-binding LytR/AlgR family response regulator
VAGRRGERFVAPVIGNDIGRDRAMRGRDHSGDGRAEAEGDYVRVHMKDYAHLVSAMLGDMEKALAGEPFLRVHRSAIVRTDKVRAISRGRFSTPALELDDGHLLPVGRKYRDAIRAALAEPRA